MVDLDMSVTQYNTCVSILFVGYSKPFLLERPRLSTNPRHSPHASSFQPDRVQNQMARNLHLRSSGFVGSCLCMHGSCPQLRRASSLPLHARIRRSGVLSRRFLLPFHVLQPQADCVQDCDLVLWKSTRQCFWHTLRNWYHRARRGSWT